MVFRHDKYQEHKEIAHAKKIDITRYIFPVLLRQWAAIERKSNLHRIQVMLNRCQRNTFLMNRTLRQKVMLMNRMFRKKIIMINQKIQILNPYRIFLKIIILRVKFVIIRRDVLVVTKHAKKVKFAIMKYVKCILQRETVKAKSVHFTVTSQMVANVDPQNESVPKTDFAELNMGLKEEYFQYISESIYETSILDINKTLDRKLLCTCGTERPKPGTDYGCALNITTKGHGSEMTEVAELAGYQCLNYNGCPCGEMRCNPGELCDINTANSKLFCRALDDEQNTVCGGQDIRDIFAITYASIYDYGCYDDVDSLNNTPGWYCTKSEGCACGNTKCEQWQMCMKPGYCGKIKLDENEREDLRYPIIKRIKDY